MATRKYPRRKRVYRKAASKKAVRLSLPRLKRVIYSTNEQKFLDVNVPGFTLGTTYTVIDMPLLVALGTNANQRIGNKIYIKEIQFRVFMNPLAAMPANGSLCRMLVVHNKQTNGATLSPTTVFATNDISSLRATPTMSRVSILRDMQHTMVFTGSAATVGPIKFSNFSVYPRRVVEFNGTTGTIADLIKDSYAVMLICSNAVGCAVTYQAKILFTDA